MGADLYFEAQNQGPEAAGILGGAIRKIKRLLGAVSKKRDLTPEEEKIVHIIDNANSKLPWMYKDGE